MIIVIVKKKKKTKFYTAITL